MNREPVGAGALRSMAAVLRAADSGAADPVAAEKARALAIAEDLQAFTRRGIIEAAAAITGEPELIQVLWRPKVSPARSATSLPAPTRRPQRARRGVTGAATRA